MPANDTSDDIAGLAETTPYLGEHGLLMFGPPKNASRETVVVADYIASLDKRAHRELGVGTPRWDHVIRFLIDAIATGVEVDDAERARSKADEAAALLYRYRILPIRNRAFYLLGALGGIALACGMGALLGLLMRSVGVQVSAVGGVAMCALAGAGSFASVLARLGTIVELREDHAAGFVVLSGATRPLVAALTSIGVSLALALGVVTIKIGDAENMPALQLLAAFLCGFSERFARDILAGVTRDASDDRPKQASAS